MYSHHVMPFVSSLFNLLVWKWKQRWCSHMGTCLASSPELQPPSLIEPVHTQAITEGCVMKVPQHQDRLCAVLALRCLREPILLLPFHGIPNARQNGLDESGWAGRVFWLAYSGGISKTKFQVRVSWLSLSAQNGLFVTQQLPWSLRTSVKAVFPPPLCTFFLFCNLVCLFFSKAGKETIIRSSYLNSRSNSFILMKKDYLTESESVSKILSLKEGFWYSLIILFPSCRSSISASEDSLFSFDSFAFVCVSQ